VSQLVAHPLTANGLMSDSVLARIAQLEILGGTRSLEEVELYECHGVTDQSLPFLAGLPRLRKVQLDGLQGVTLEGTRVFPRHVRVKYST
jgi:hypothetical protein